MPQMQLPFFPEGATEINSHLAIIREGEQVSYIYGHLPIFRHNVQDNSAFRMIISQLYINGSVKQSEICRTFGVTQISVKRSVKLYREKGAAGIGELNGVSSSFTDSLDVPNQPTEQEIESDPLLHRFTVIFDREGYSPELFQRLKDRRIACLTYHKSSQSRIPPYRHRGA